MFQLNKISTLCACIVLFARSPISATSLIAVSNTDTVKLSVPDAEQRLLDKSLLLIAAHYNVDIARSEVTQVKAWYNPAITYSQTMYDPSRKTWMDNSSATGQADVQFDQLVSIAGRHINAVRLAELQVKRDQYAFDDLARSLKYEMYEELSSLYESQEFDAVYTSEIRSLDEVIAAMQHELKLGAAAGNDVIRLKAERQSTISDQLANSYTIADLEAQLRVLLGFPENNYIEVNAIPLSTGRMPMLDSILQLSQNRPDVLLANTDVQFCKRELSLQKSLAVPDLHIGAEYDHRNSYVMDLWQVRAGIAIPIYDRNQGNIRAARYALLQSQLQDTLQINTANSEVVSAYSECLRIRNVRESLIAQPGVISNTANDPGSYARDIDLLFSNALSNYSNRRISLLEFLDQLRTFEEARTGLITLDSDYFNAIQKLNYSAGSVVLK